MYPVDKVICRSWVVLAACLAAFTACGGSDVSALVAEVGGDGGLLELKNPSSDVKIRVEVPAGAVDETITLTAVPETDLVGTAVPKDIGTTPENETMAGVVTFGPAGTKFETPIAVEIPISSAGVPASVRAVYLRDEITGDWSTATMQDGSVIVGIVSTDGKSVAFLTDHFSTYAVGSLETIFCSPGWATDYPLAVPCSFYSESAFAAAGTDVMLLESARKKMYVQVLKELLIRTERPRSAAELNLVELFTKNLDEVVGDETVGYKNVLKVFKYLQLGTDDLLKTDLPEFFDNASDLTALSGGFKFIKDQTAWFSTTLKVEDCVVESFLKLFALHAVDYARALDRWEAVETYVVDSDLYLRDPAFRAAFAQVRTDIRQLQDSVPAQILDSLPQLGEADCGMSILSSLIKFAMKPLITALKGSGVGLVASVIFDLAVVDVVMDDMVAATQKGLALAALGTFYVHGGLYDATKDIAGTDVTSASWQSESMRTKLLAFEVSNYANLAIHQSAAEVMRMEGAGWLNKNLTGIVNWSGSMFGGVSREDIAKAHDARMAELELNDTALVDSYPSLCSGTGTLPAVCRNEVPCVGVCGLSVCGDDGCGVSCGTCDADENCNTEGVCVAKVPVCPAAKDCTGLVCGLDPVCGVSCGTCDVGNECQTGQCVPSVCVADCTGLDCGPDLVCGQSCGTCDMGFTCKSGGCVQDACVPACGTAVCGLDPVCGTLGCGTCGDGYTCQSGSCVESSVYGEMVLIPAGPFWMGCNSAVDDDCDSDESPYHEVTLSGYYIDKTEVTQSAYKECVDAGSCTTPSSGFDPSVNPNRPVVYVNWTMAAAYCMWAGKRLPTEAEWEKAARGTDGRKYPWGNEDATCDYAVMNDSSAGGDGCGTYSTWAVCGKSPAGDSPYGLCDMSGNVWEWVSDWYGSDYYSSSPASNPTGPDSGSSRVRRGGGFDTYGDGSLRASLRSGYYYPSDYYDYHLGFRCASPQ